jgi:hypothetical protein
MHVLGHAVRGLLPAGRLDLAEIVVSVASVFQMAVKTVPAGRLSMCRSPERLRPLGKIRDGGAQEAKPRGRSHERLYVD